MERLGGQQAWDETRYVSWSFFGRRLNLWDKHTNTIRVELDRGQVGSIVVVMNTVNRRGRVWKNGEPVTDPYSISQMIEAAHSAWINDSYWVFMPYKLKDDGVTLKYLGVRPMADGRPGEALEVTFDGVGKTPQNKYHVYVGLDTGLVEQWDFFKTRDQETLTLSTPWTNWTRHGRIMLSDDRGDGRVHSQVGVWQTLPETAFTSPDPVDLDQATPAKGE